MGGQDRSEINEGNRLIETDTNVSPALSSDGFVRPSCLNLSTPYIQMKFMRRATVPRITRIIFLAWLIVTAVLLWQTIGGPARSAPAHEIGA